MNAVCDLCPHHCSIPEGKAGFCRARGCIDGKIVCLSYGRAASISLDPIEKKPLARFYPGSKILSYGSWGCNLRCGFCQNHEISQHGSPTDCPVISPEELVSKAADLIPRGNIGLAYTYNEPLTSYEFVRDCAELVHAGGMKNVLVSNGTVCEKPYCALLPLLDAVNIDLKGFSQDFYDGVDGFFDTVKRTIELSAAATHTEVTYLAVTGLNDTPDEVAAAAHWLAGVDPDITLHISRFFPRYRMTDRPATPVGTVKALAETAGQWLANVYTGNI